MEIYNKNLSNSNSKEFEQLLNSHHSKASVEEGKIIEGVINKITEKYAFLYIENTKSEPVIDIQEAKSILGENLKEGSKIPVLIESLENKSGEVVVSASKARKIKGWEQIISYHEKNEPIIGKITSKVKGGFIVEHVDTGTLAFLPGSQVDVAPIKDVSKLMNVPQKFAIIKIDKVRGNICVSRREIISSFKKEDKAKLIAKYKVGDLIKDAVVKGFSSFGCFFSVNNELDVLTHLQELSYSRIDHPSDILEIGEKRDLKVISVDESKLQIGCSIKQLYPDPFDNIDNYKLNTRYFVKVEKISDFGAFCTLESGLTTLLHNSELSWTKKNISAKKILKVGQEIPCVITDIDKDKRRVAISHRLTQENPFETFEKRYPINTTVEGVVVNKNEYSLFVKIEDLDIDAFLHCNDLTYLDNGEEELAKYKKGDKIKVKVLEIKTSEQKIRVGLKQTQADPFDFFKDKAKGDTLTVKVVKTDNKGLTVQPENCEMNFQIKKSEIALNAADARPSRWTGGEKVDVGIKEIFLDKRKVTLSIKFLEEALKNEALKKYGSDGDFSGRNLPFSSLSEDLKKKDKKKK